MPGVSVELLHKPELGAGWDVAPTLSPRGDPKVRESRGLRLGHRHREAA